MSKLAKKPIQIAEGVELKTSEGVLEFSGKEGKLAVKLPSFVSVALKDRQLFLKVTSQNKQSRANIGTAVALIKNAIVGVSQGFQKILELEGIGFRAAMEGGNLVLNVGFSHPVKYVVPAGIKIAVEKNTIKVNGIDKALVGQVAANVRKIWPPEPYQGKGIRYRGEVVRRKAGKRVAGAGAGIGGAA